MIIIALSLGLTSGFHCLGMCGPIALTISLNAKNKFQYYFQNLIYQLGRITTYILIGGILGLIGESFSFVGIQNQLSIITGILLILIVIFPRFASKISHFFSTHIFFFKLKLKLKKFLKKKSISSKFIIGILNGFLPCGAVYVALTSSMAFGSIIKSIIFMGYFGIGTIPMMFLAVIFGNIINMRFRNILVRFYPLIVIIIGTIFILRGMELGILHISPNKASLQIEPTKECCQKD